MNFSPERAFWVGRASISVAVVAAVLMVVMGGAVLRDSLALSGNDPLTSKRLEALRKKALESPDDKALRFQVEEMDLVLRRTHFLLLERVRRGVVVMAVAGLALLLSLRMAGGVSRRVPNVDRGPVPLLLPEDVVRARLGVALTWSAVIILLACIFWGGVGLGPTGLTPSSASASFADAPWPDFRGPRGSARADTAEIAWKGRVKPKIMWRTHVPRQGFSSPVVAGGRVFLTGGDKSARETFCFDVSDGSLLWRKVVPFFAVDGAALPKPTEDTGFAASTMAINGDVVCAIFATGDIAAFTLDGAPLWRMNPGVPDNHYAYASSLMAVDGKVLVQLDHSSSGSIMALSARDGAELWAVDRSESISWASPIVAGIDTPDGGKRLVAFFATSSAVAAYDVETGQNLWRTECLSGEVAPSPTFDNGRIFVANDTAAAVALDATSGKILWSRDDVDLPDVASPLATPAGRVYLAASFGVVTCLNAESGATIWTKEFKNGFYASPILLGGSKIFLVDLKGNIFILNDSDKYEVLAEAALGGDVQATPAFAYDSIFIRNGDEIMKIAVSGP